MALRLRTSPWRWWPAIRNFWLVVGVYVAGAVSVMLTFPLWLWLMIEAALRYFPFWLQVVVLVILGVQLDWILNWPLGSGLLAVSLLWLLFIFGRRWRHPVVFVSWHLISFLIFLVMAAWLLGGVNPNLLGLQLALYSLTLVIRVILGKQT